MRKSTIPTVALIIGIATLSACTPNPDENTAAGTLGGAGAGAAIGCLATIPVGCVPGAIVGAAIGSGGNCTPIVIKKFSDMPEDDRRNVIRGALFCAGIFVLFAYIAIDRYRVAANKNNKDR